MNDYVSYGEGVIGIERYDPGVPADSGRQYNDVFAWVYFVPAQPAIRRAKHINGQRDPVKRLNETFEQKERGRCREIVFEKPPKLARQMSMPVDERIKRRQVDRAAVQPASEAIAFPDSGAVEHD